MKVLFLPNLYSSPRHMYQITSILIIFICRSHLYRDRFRCLEFVLHHIFHRPTPLGTLFVYVFLEVLRQLRIVWNQLKVLFPFSSVYHPVRSRINDCRRYNFYRVISISALLITSAVRRMCFHVVILDQRSKLFIFSNSWYLYLYHCVYLRYVLDHPKLQPKESVMIWSITFLEPKFGPVCNTRTPEILLRILGYFTEHLPRKMILQQFHQVGPVEYTG